MKESQKPLIYIILPVFAGIALIAFFSLLSSNKGREIPPPPADLAQKESTQEYDLGEPVEDKRISFYTLPGGLDEAQIHDIKFYDGAMWLGTDKGLLRIKDKKITQFRQFSAWPFEWVKDLTFTPAGIVVQTYVAQGNTGGTPAGTNIFDPKTQHWKQLGRNALAQIWYDGALYQASSKLVKRMPENDWKADVIVQSICGKSPTSLSMIAAAQNLWIVGQGSTLRQHASSSIGCGLTRYNPADNSTTVFHVKDGLLNEYGWDIAGDDKAVYISHSIKDNTMSVYNIKEDKLGAYAVGGSGNHISVSPKTIWIAKATPSLPLRRIDRGSGLARNFGAFSPPVEGQAMAEETKEITEGTAPTEQKKPEPNEYVSAIGLDGNQVWIGTYIKVWDGPKYTIKSRLGVYEDK